jgi:hypothetical protein
MINLWCSTSKPGRFRKKEWSMKAGSYQKQNFRKLPRTKGLNPWLKRDKISRTKNEIIPSSINFKFQNRNKVRIPKYFQRKITANQITEDTHNSSKLIFHLKFKLQVIFTEQWDSFFTYKNQEKFYHVEVFRDYAPRKIRGAKEEKLYKEYRNIAFIILQAVGEY